MTTFLRQNAIDEGLGRVLAFTAFLFRAVFVAVKILPGGRIPLEITVSFAVYFKLGIIPVDAYAAEIFSRELLIFPAGYLDIFRACSAPFQRSVFMCTPRTPVGSEIHGELNKAARHKGQAIFILKYVLYAL